MNHANFTQNSGIYSFDSGIEWPIVAIFGGIHGNEVAGVRVIDELRRRIDRSELIIERGKLTLAYGNEMAIGLWVKQVEHNLNRLFRPDILDWNEQVSDSYEVRRARVLANILLETDYLLDIHSVSSNSEPFMFTSTMDIPLASQIGCEKYIVGWGEATGSDVIAGDTDSFIKSNWGVWFTLECGNHYSLYAFSYGLEKTLLFLEVVWLIKGGDVWKRKTSLSQDFYRMDRVVTSRSGKFIFIDSIRNFQEFQKGQVIWNDGDVTVIAETDGYILLPNMEKIVPGEEVYYWGSKLSI